MGNRIYLVPFENVTCTSSQDFWEIQPADDKPIRILGWNLSNVGGTADAGDAQEEFLRMSIVRGHTSSGSGGTSPTISPANFNDPSVVNGKKFMVFDYLTNTTRWFVQTDADNGFYWDWREKPQFERDNVALLMQAVYIAFFRAMWGAEDPRCAYSSNAV